MPKFIVTQVEESYITREIEIEAGSADLASEMAEDIDSDEWTIVYSHADRYIDEVIKEAE